MPLALAENLILRVKFWPQAVKIIEATIHLVIAEWLLDLTM